MRVQRDRRQPSDFVILRAVAPGASADHAPHGSDERPFRMVSHGPAVPLDALDIHDGVCKFPIPRSRLPSEDLPVVKICTHEAVVALEGLHHRWHRKVFDVPPLM